MDQSTFGKPELQNARRLRKVQASSRESRVFPSAGSNQPSMSESRIVSEIDMS